METLVFYIAKAGICLGIFLIVYALFLRQTTFFRFNRLFLLFGFIVSFILPFVKYSYNVTIPATISEGLGNFNIKETEVSDSNLYMWNIIVAIYLLGITTIIFKNIYAYFKLSKLINGGAKSDNDGFKIIDNTKVGSPFSVLNYILLNTSALSNTEKDLILKHELIHVKQKHWIDLLCCELIIMIQWFNPLAWIYVQLLKENHEFLADKAVLDSGISPVIYQAVLVNQEFKEPIFSFSNSFNYSKSLKRLSMMKKTKSSQWKKAAILLTIPFSGMFLWASATPNYIIEKQIVNDSIVFIKNKNQDAVSDTAELKGKVKVISYKKNLSDKDATFTMTNIPITDADKKPLILVDNKRIDNLNEVSPEDIESINVLKGDAAVSIHGEGAKDGVIIVTKKNKGIDNKALLVVDGVIKSMDELQSIKPDDIESISILKEKSATDKYGEKGKNGVIEVTKKK